LLVGVLVPAPPPVPRTPGIASTRPPGLVLTPAKWRPGLVVKPACVAENEPLAAPPIAAAAEIAAIQIASRLLPRIATPFRFIPTSLSQCSFVRREGPD
jgi:hypothetical protein